MLSRNTKRTILALTFAGTVVIIFAAATRHYFAARALAIRLEEERAALVEPEPLIVEIGTMDFDRRRSFAVRLDPYRRSRIAVEVSGRVDSVHVEAGDRVEAGDLLAKLDDTLARLSFRAAEASLAAARQQETELARRVREAETLAASRTLPETQLEAARAQLEVQQSEIERLRIEVERQRELVERHRVTAPFSGWVEERLIEPGESLNPNTTAATLAALDPLRARLFVSDLDLPAFEVGQELTVRFDATGEPPVTATVSAVNRSADSVTGLFTVEARAENPGGGRPAGLQGTVTVTTRRYRGALFIPAAAVRFEGPRALATVRNGDGGDEIRALRLGAEVEGHYPVLDGLATGERVLIH